MRSRKGRNPAKLNMIFSEAGTEVPTLKKMFSRDLAPPLQLLDFKLPPPTKVQNPGTKRGGSRPRRPKEAIINKQRKKRR